MYNIRWCTLHNFMNPYFTKLFFLSLPYSDDLHWLELAKDAYLQNPSSSTLRNDGQSWWNGTWTWWSSCGKRLTHKNKWSRIIQSRRWHVFIMLGYFPRSRTFHERWTSAQFYDLFMISPKMPLNTSIVPFCLVKKIAYLPHSICKW